MRLLRLRTSESGWVTAAIPTKLSERLVLVKIARCEHARRVDEEDQGKIQRTSAKAGPWNRRMLCRQRYLPSELPGINHLEISSRGNGPIKGFGRLGGEPFYNR